MVNKALERAQGKVEARNFDIRKSSYDDVMNLQRKSIFSQRREIRNLIMFLKQLLRCGKVDNLVWENISEIVIHHNGSDLLKDKIKDKFGLNLPLDNWVEEENFVGEELQDRINSETTRLFEEKKNRYGLEIIQTIEKQVC